MILTSQKLPQYGKGFLIVLYELYGILTLDTRQRHVRHIKHVDIQVTHVYDELNILTMNPSVIRSAGQQSLQDI